MKTNALAWIGGKVLDPENAKVSVFDRGFLFGDGVYETGRSYNRVMVYLEEHLERLRRSAGKLLIDVPWTDAEIKKGLFEVARAFEADDLYFRTIVTRGPVRTVSLDEMPEGKPTLVHLVQSLDLDALEKKRQKGIKVLTSRVQRNSAQAQDPNIKTSNYLNSLLALQDVKSRGGDDAILCDSDGSVTEGTTFSVFGVSKEGTLLTPSLDVGILDSITRRHVLALGQALGKAEEGAFSLARLQNCSEVFIASSVREIIPVNAWDEKKYSPLPGAVTKVLQGKLRAHIDEYVRTHEAF